MVGYAIKLNLHFLADATDGLFLGVSYALQQCRLLPEQGQNLICLFWRRIRRKYQAHISLSIRAPPNVLAGFRTGKSR